MQTAGKKERSAMDNLIIMNTIIENQRAQLNTHMFFADAVKCFDEVWLKDCLLEMYNLGYDPNTLKILHEMNRETDITIRTPMGNTESIHFRSKKW